MASKVIRFDRSTSNTGPFYTVGLIFKDRDGFWKVRTVTTEKTSASATVDQLDPPTDEERQQAKCWESDPDTGQPGWRDCS